MSQVLILGAIIVTLAMGTRHGFGLWLQPITQANGWGRQEFSVALAIQNISWGFFGIFAGMVADRFGAFKVIVIGAVCYGLGLYGMAVSSSPFAFAMTAGVLVGAAQARIVRLSFTHSKGHFHRHPLPVRRNVPATGAKGARVVHRVPVVKAAVFVQRPNLVAS